MNDTDRDGVLDILDQKNNLVTGVSDNNKGVIIDADINGTPDQLEINAAVNSTQNNVRENIAYLKKNPNLHHDEIENH